MSSYIPSGRLTYVRPQEEGAPRSGGMQTKLSPAAHIWRENSNFKFGIYLYLCRNFIAYFS